MEFFVIFLAMLVFSSILFTIVWAWTEKPTRIWVWFFAGWSLYVSERWSVGLSIGDQFDIIVYEFVALMLFALVGIYAKGGGKASKLAPNTSRQEQPE